MEETLANDLLLKQTFCFVSIYLFLFWMLSSQLIFYRIYWNIHVEVMSIDISIYTPYQIEYFRM